MNFIEELKKGLHTGFINFQKASLEDYQPSLLINDRQEEKRVLTTLIKELNECDAFYFSVAFITNSGIASIINVLKELEERGIKGKIIASQYQNFTQPQALRRLKALSNIELKIVTEDNFHAKSYIFRKGTRFTLIIGSSNLTQNALSYNKEWNLKVSSAEDGDLLKYTMKEFNRTFESAIPVTDQWLADYEILYKDQYKASRQVVYDIQTTKAILPNKMQLEALEALEKLRSEGKDKALLISATGTGKTYFSAFDAKRVNPKRLLFVVHRENITRASLRSYKRIFGRDVTMGILSGNNKDYEARFLFSTIQTLSKDHVLEQFEPDHFDYIVIDEVHRSGSSTYEKILNYFKPKFLLGMSATPERTDGYDIYKTFDYNIAYEIRLNKALEEQMLCPFHYYGVSELEINGEVIDEKTAFNHLVCDERVEHIIDKAKLYGCDHGRIKGLIFCSGVKEAKELSEQFNGRGYQTVALDGSSSENEREEAIERLEKDAPEGDYLDYIFTVDIFNEGVDIPSINQIIMLRPTQSSIVFVQQLGRGLRKSEGKEYVVVIDFIGNYANNFLVPIALYGDCSFNKDHLRKLMSNGSCSIPGVSTVNFDRITKERIYEGINKSNMATKKALVEEYKLLKFKLGRVPMMMDFILHGSRDPFAFVEYSGSYYQFVASVEQTLESSLSVAERAHLEFYSKELGSGKRIEELMLLDVLIREGELASSQLRQLIKEAYGYDISEATLESSIRYLNGDFFKKQDQEKYARPHSILMEDQGFKMTEGLKSDLKNSHFKTYLLDLIAYGIDRFNKAYTLEAYEKGFIRYQKYSRKDVCRILNWESDESSTMYGYRIKYNTCPIFVTYHKQDDISESTKYEDCFINKKQFSWMTRSGVTTESKETIAIRDHDKTGLRIALFVKKSDGEGSDFYYMGDVEPMAISQTTIKNDKGEDKPIVNILFDMAHSVPDHLYDYLTQ